MKNVQKIEQFTHPKQWDGSRISVNVIMQPGIPLDPTAYAKTILSTIKLLNACGEEAGVKKKSVIWMLIEAAVIGDKGTFTLQGIDSGYWSAGGKTLGTPPHEPTLAVVNDGSASASAK